MIKKIISWDLGATKCSAGILEYDPLTQQLTCKKTASVKLTQAHSLEHLISLLETELGDSMATANAICIGGAGQYDGNDLLLTSGYPFPMNFKATAKKLHWPPFEIIHDYASVVCATFTSYMQNSANMHSLNPQIANPLGRRVALGLGTGLGLKDGILLPTGDFWLGCNEIGHIGITCPLTNDAYSLTRHKELLSFLQLSGTPTFEQILSGPGLVRLYRFLYNDSPAITPEEVGLKINSGQTPELLQLFAWYLGLFIGTVQLIFMPDGGIWITGGVSLHHLNVFNQPEFNQGIQSSPAYLTQRQEFPLGVLCNPDHALYGGGYYAVKRLMDFT